MASVPVQIFEAGTWTDSSGVTRSFSEADLQQMADSYDPQRHEAPLLVNHNASEENLGLIQSVFRAGKRLFAIPKKVAPRLAEAVNSGRWPKISTGLYSPTDPASPTPGNWAVREVSVVQIPGVKGMLAPQFSEPETPPEPPSYPVFTFSEALESKAGFYQFEEANLTIPDTQKAEQDSAPSDAQTYTFAEVEAAKERIATQAAITAQLHRAAEERAAALDVREKQLKFAEVQAKRSSADWQFVQARATEGRLAGPQQIETAFALLNSCDADRVCFGEGSPDARSQYQLFKDFLKAMPEIVTYGEFAASSKSVTGLAGTATARDIQREANKLVDSAKASGRQLSYEDAVQQVSEQMKGA